MTDQADRIALVERAELQLSNGNVFDAFELTSEGLSTFPGDVDLTIVGALALARTGAVQEAVHRLQPFASDLSQTRISALNLVRIARVHREAWRQIGSEHLLVRAAELARSAADRQHDAWHLALAASLSHCVEQRERAHAYAEEVLLSSDAATVESAAARLLAGIVLTQNETRLTDLTNQFLARAGRDYSWIVDLRRTIAELAGSGLTVPETILERLLPPKVVVFAGHDLDPPGKSPTCLTNGHLAALQAALSQRLDRLDARIGYVSPSAGSALLFVEAMIQRGAEVNLVLPFAKDDFIARNVAYAGSDWVDRLERALSACQAVAYASHGPYLGHDMLYRYCNQMLHGLAMLRANFVDTEPHLLAVWDYQEGSLTGGAADFIDQWGDISRLSIIDLSEIESDGTPPCPPMPEKPQEPPVEPERVLRVVLFADILGFSKLTDREIPAFLCMMERIQRDLALEFEPETVNSWGDALFVVMTDAHDLAGFALRLRDLIRHYGTPDQGLPDGLDCRLSLHAGPVFQTLDPFTKRPNFWGFDINRAARLEPVTVPGHVYATQPFVALLAAEIGARRAEAEQDGRTYKPPIATEYVGSLAFAKNFGEEPVYHVRRALGAC